MIRTSRVWLCGALAALVLSLVAAACVPGSRSALMKAGARSGAIRLARFEPGYGCALEGDTHSADTHYAQHAQCESLIVATADTDKRSKCDESLLLRFLLGAAYPVLSRTPIQQLLTALNPSSLLLQPGSAKELLLSSSSHSFGEGLECVPGRSPELSACLYALSCRRLASERSK